WIDLQTVTEQFTRADTRAVNDIRDQAVVCGDRCARHDGTLQRRKRRVSAGIRGVHPVLACCSRVGAAWEDARLKVTLDLEVVQRRVGSDDGRCQEETADERRGSKTHE